MSVSGGNSSASLLAQLAATDFRKKRLNTEFDQCARNRDRDRDSDNVSDDDDDDEDEEKSDHSSSKRYKEEHLSNSQLAADAAVPTSSILLDEFVPLPGNEWLFETDIDERTGQEIKDTKWCFLCEYDEPTGCATSNPHFAKIDKHIRDNHGKQDDRLLCETLQRIYNKYCRDSIEPMHPPWAKCSIYRHIYITRPVPVCDSARDFRRINQLIDCLVDNGLMVKSGDGKKAIHKDNAQLLLKLLDQKAKLYRRLENK